MSKSYGRGPLLGAALAILLFVSWAAAAFAAVGTGADSTAALDQTRIVQVEAKMPRSKPRLAAMVLAGFSPALLMVARVRRQLADSPDEASP